MRKGTREGSRCCLTWFKPLSVSVSQLWGDWATHVNVPAMRCGYFVHQRRLQFERCVAEPLQTITAIFRGSKWSGLLLSCGVAIRVERSDEGVPASEAEGLRGRYHSFHERAAKGPKIEIARYATYDGHDSSESVAIVAQATACPVGLCVLFSPC